MKSTKHGAYGGEKCVSKFKDKVKVWLMIIVKDKLVSFLLTAVYEHQLTMVDVSLGEVQDRSGGGTLQGKVSITGRSDNKLQALRGRVVVSSTEVIAGDFCDRVDPNLQGQKSHFIIISAIFLSLFFWASS